LRYAHSAEHVRAALEAAGLCVLTLALVSPRLEAGVPVPGLMVVAGITQGPADPRACVRMSAMRGKPEEIGSL